MSSTELILDKPSEGQIRVTPNHYPVYYLVLFRGEGQAFYGTNGAPPETPLPKDRQVNIKVEGFTMDIKYKSEGKAGLQWGEEV